MKKKDYVKIADLIGGLEMESQDIYYISIAFSNMLAADNPRFNREKFINAVESARMGNRIEKGGWYK